MPPILAARCSRGEARSWGRIVPSFPLAQAGGGALWPPRRVFRGQGEAVSRGRIGPERLFGRCWRLSLLKREAIITQMVDKSASADRFSATSASVAVPRRVAPPPVRRDERARFGRWCGDAGLLYARPRC